MNDTPMEMKVDLQEPYPNFFTTLHTMMLGEIEYNRLRVTLTQIGIGLIVAYIVISVVLCMLSILLPLFGMGIVASALQKFIQLAPKGLGPN
jgi:hypothetical protein